MNKEDFLGAMVEFYNMTTEEKSDMGKAGRKHVLDNYSFSKFSGLWYQTFQNIFEEFGSWENRKNYKAWELVELK